MAFTDFMFHSERNITIGNASAKNVEMQFVYIHFSYSLFDVCLIDSYTGPKDTIRDHIFP